LQLLDSVNDFFDANLDTIINGSFDRDTVREKSILVPEILLQECMIFIAMEYLGVSHEEGSSVAQFGLEF